MSPWHSISSIIFADSDSSFVVLEFVSVAIDCCCCRPSYTILEKNKSVTKFLNRMLAMSLRDQKLLFAYFSDTLVRVCR